MRSLDTETTGVDFGHGARPFFVTTCDDAGEIHYWEWDVDPLTRKPQIPEEDIDEIAELLSPNQTDYVVFQNAKFDVKALSTIRPEFGEYWRWGMTYDTLLAGHLLASNQPHNLTDMVIQYLDHDIEPFEKRAEKIVGECRHIIQQARLRVKRGGEPDPLDDWRIAQNGLPEMPSAKEKCWKYDMWLPRALAKHYKHPPDHPWWTVLSDYANADSAATIALFKVQRAEIERRNLWRIYEERLKVLPTAYKMEQRGITINRDALRDLKVEFRKESATNGAECIRIAATHGVDLILPKAGNNKLLLQASKAMLDFHDLKVSRSQAAMDRGSGGSAAVFVRDKTASGELSLSAASIESYIEQTPKGSPENLFFVNLAQKRKRDTAISYMDSYERFWLKWIPVGPIDSATGAGWYVLHPNLNPTGTNTLRWSSNNPNEQNISKRGMFEGDKRTLRVTFGPAPGREWWSMDAKNIELRLPAYECGEQLLIDLFEREDEPPYYGSEHILNFSVVWPELWSAAIRAVGLEKAGPYCKKKYASTNYQWTKNGDFAVGYGAVDRADGQGTADRAFHRPGAHAMLKSRFAKKEALNQKWIAYAKRYGYVETIPDKTVDPERGYPLICSRTDSGQILPTVPLNYHIQSSAMWWMMKAMIRCQAQLDEWNQRGYDGHIALQVHDELVFDLPKKPHPLKDPKRSNLGKIRVLKRLMEQGGDDFGIPTPVGCEYHETNWQEGVAV